MPLDNNIKVTSTVRIVSPVKVNEDSIIVEDVFDWQGIVATDETATIWQNETYVPENATVTGTANLKERTDFDTSGVTSEIPGTYEVVAHFKEFTSSYDVVVQPVTFELTVAGYTLDWYTDDEIEFDGTCYAEYTKPDLSGFVTPDVELEEITTAGMYPVHLSYTDDYYHCTRSKDYNICVFEHVRHPINMNLMELEDFEDWTSSYTRKVYDYGEEEDDQFELIMESVNKQDVNITDMPVTKGQPVIIKSLNNLRYIDSVQFGFTQWPGKAQTILLDYSLDDGYSWIDSGESWDNYFVHWLAPEGVIPNAVRIRFSSATNQIGLRNILVGTHYEDEPIHVLRIEGPNAVNVGDEVTFTAFCTVEPDEVTWEVLDGGFRISLFDNEDGTCTVEGLENGEVRIAATCLGDAHAEKVFLVTGGGEEEQHVETINFTGMFNVDTSVHDTVIPIGDLGNIEVYFNKGTNKNEPKYFVNGQEIRVYGSNYITVRCVDGGHLIQIVYTVSQGINPFTSDVETLTWNNNDKEWNTSTNDVESVTITEDGTSGNVRFKSIEVTYMK